MEKLTKLYRFKIESESGVRNHRMGIWLTANLLCTSEKRDEYRLQTLLSNQIVVYIRSIQLGVTRGKR